jgi:ABC-type lipoprotein release transport system permease subunit
MDWPLLATVLQALGFLARVVRWAFLLESSFVAVGGILLGTALSPVTSSLLFRNDDDLQSAGVAFPIPWMSISLLVLATAAASLAATSWPARRAARIRPTLRWGSPTSPTGGPRPRRCRGSCRGSGQRRRRR